MKRKNRNNLGRADATLCSCADLCDGEFSHLCEIYGCMREGSLSAVMRGFKTPPSQLPSWRDLPSLTRDNRTLTH
jgi:hypothetical protein